MITSQLPVSAWHDVFGEPGFADAVHGRISHQAYRIKVEDKSMGTTIAKKDDEAPHNLIPRNQCLTATRER